MTNETLEGDSRTIAEFMGWEWHNEYVAYGLVHPRGYYSGDIAKDGVFGIEPNMLKFHSSWDWLHDPYNKFFSLTEFDTVTDGKFHNRNPYFVQQLQELKSAWSSLNIKLAFEQIVTAIKWYNQQNPKP